MIFKASIDYGVRIMLYLAVKGDVCSSREIAEEMSIPRDYLIQIALHLRNAGLIKAKPGKNGGYVLTKSPAKISLGNVIDVFDKEFKHSRKQMKKSKKMSAQAESVYRIHGVVSESMNEYLDAISLQDLLGILNDETTTEKMIAGALEAEAAQLRARS